MPKIVEAPQPSPLLAGSLRSTVTVTENADRLLDGVTFRPHPCGTGHLLELCPTEPDSKTITGSGGAVEFDGFGFWEGDTCTTLSREDFGEAVRRIREKLDRASSWYLEQGLWTLSLATTDAENLTGTADPAGIVPAVSELVGAVNDDLRGDRAIIHVPQSAVPYLEFYGLVDRQANILRLAGTDHVFVAGAGYPGTDPSGNPADVGTTWFYVTGPVRAEMSSIDAVGGAEYEVIDRATNNVEVRLERAAAVWFDPCIHAGINVCLPDPGPACEVVT